MVIAFSGIDGAGKTGIIKDIQLWLETHGYNVYVIKAVNSMQSYCINFNKVVDAYKDKYNKNLPATAGAILLGFQLFQESEGLKENLHKYDFILLDRWTLCHRASSSAYLVKDEILDIILDSCFLPDITFIIDVDVNEALERIHKRGVAKKQESYYILKRVQKKYLQYCNEVQNTFFIENQFGLYNEAIDNIKRTICRTMEDGENENQL